jgi:hypothetical protein
VVYKKGADNSVADALSKRSHDSKEVWALSTVTPKWISDVVASYTNDPKASTLLTKLVVDP